MTQQKAASLTSSLFACKGRASPASLLISELAAAEADSTGAAAPDAAAAGTNGGGKARGAGANGARLNGSGLNGSDRRKPKPSEQLPLLAFVEARESSEPGAPEPDAPEQYGPEEEAPGQAASERVSTQAEPPPAASLLAPSLLGRGARPLRRPDTRGAEADTAVPLPPVATVPDAGEHPEGVPEEVIEAEVVSGDANVAAIEDAPHEGEGEGEAATAAGADAPESELAEPEAAEPETAEAAAAEAEPAPAAAPPAPGMPATLALRQAAALASASPAPAAVRPETMPPPVRDHAPARGHGALWRSTAVLALGGVLGLGLYLALAGEPAAPPPTASAAAEAPTVAALPPQPAPPEPAAPALPPAQAAAEPPGAEPPPAQAVADPSFDVIRIEPDGQSIIAGRATPGSRWILLNNGSPIASVQADANGEWVVLPDSALVPGANAFSLVPKDERGKVAIPAPAGAAPQPSTPETTAPDPAAPAAPVAQETPGPRAEAGAPALPKPKPQQAAAASPPPVTFRAIEDGAYEVQLASVRQTADAERESRRLAAAFPQLLGAMDLRVEEATLEGAGVFYRVRSGAIGELALARELCRRLEVAGQGCLVVRRPEAAPSAVADDVPDAAAAVRQQAAERPR